MKAIKLRFNCPVHLGRGRDEPDKAELIYHSDSLRAALYAVGLPYFREWQNEKLFYEHFRISSCFPFAGDEFFLPRPMLHKKIDLEKIDEDRAAKKIKRIEFLEKSVFENFINNTTETLRASATNITPDGMFLCKNRSTFIKEKNGKQQEFAFFKNEVQQRVKVAGEHETEQESKPFYLDRIFFADNCGLYFLAEFDNDTIMEQVLHALAILGERGIGTDRTVGNGLFDFNPDNDVTDFAFNIQCNTGAYLTLGLYLPTPEEHAAIDFDKSAWALVKRGGFMAGSDYENFIHLRKKSVFMFAEGSVFFSSQHLTGKYTNLQPDWNDERMHPVWRDGKCLMIKC